MNNFKFVFILLLLSVLFRSETVNAQCIVVDTLNGIYGFNDPNGSGSYTGFLCSLTDSVGTEGSRGYFDGDGYMINLVSGSQVIFSVDSCTGNPVSLTVADSANQIIQGAYAGPACPNALNFTAPYTGTFIVVMNVNGICGGGGTTVIGEVHVQIQQGTNIPSCPDANVYNDTICGAQPLEIDSPFVHGNTSLAYPTDPLDGYVIALGDTCSTPNNTLWYSFSPQTNIDTVYIGLTSDPGSNFHSWLMLFSADSTVNPCRGGLNFISCNIGPDDANGIDSVSIPLYGLSAGEVYYFMIDGVSGSTGGFSITMLSKGNTIYVEPVNAHSFYSVYPNPAKNSFRIKSTVDNKFLVTLFNSVGQEVFHKNYDNQLNEEIDISTFSPGVYTLKMTGINGIYTCKLIVNN